MAEFILKTTQSIQSVKLIEYLKTLDYVSITPKKTIANKSKNGLTTFLENLPEIDYNETEVVEAIKDMRREKKN